jgi:hypothetical protein
MTVFMASGAVCMQARAAGAAPDGLRAG